MRQADARKGLQATVAAWPTCVQRVCSHGASAHWQYLHLAVLQIVRGL